MSYEGKLLRSEWMAIWSLACVILSLSIVAKWKESDCLEDLPFSLPQNHEYCEVTVRGAVSKPGTFRVLPGSLLKTILRKSGLLPSSNLRSFDLQSRIVKSMEIEVLELEEIFIRICKGDEDSIALALPVGTKVSDLRSFGLCDEHQAKISFNSRRVLRDGEEIDLSHSQ